MAGADQLLVAYAAFHETVSSGPDGAWCFVSAHGLSRKVGALRYWGEGPSRLTAPRSSTRSAEPDDAHPCAPRTFLHSCREFLHKRQQPFDFQPTAVL